MTRKQIEAVIQLGEAIVDTVAEVQEAPAGIVYAALMGITTHEQFEQIISLLVQAGRLRRNGHILSIPPR